jgi:hypothetical protein
MSVAQAEKIRITDLAAPVLDESQKAALAYATANPVIMTTDAVLEAARARTGLTDFGDSDFLPRLGLWMQSAGEDANLSPLGRVGVYNEAVRYAVSRLYVEDYIKRHPEVLQTNVDQPFLIAGLPRSGTTYLLALMSADTRLRSLPHWEAVRPVAEPFIKDGVDTRFDLCAAEWARTDALMPFIKNIHEFAPEHISEDIELQGVAFGGYYPEWLAMVPRWRDWQLANDQSAVYRYMRKVMQVLSAQRGPERWVTKCPQHMEKLLEVSGAFKDPVVVINHRDPVASIQSAITGIAYSARITRTRVDMAEIANYWIDRYERLLRACVRDRDALPEARACDIYFHDLMQDPLGQLQRIYDRSDMELDATTCSKFEAAMAANRRGKHGQLVYDLRGDFGLEPDAIRERFAFYFDRFPVKIEVQ